MMNWQIEQIITTGIIVCTPMQILPVDGGEHRDQLKI